MVDARKLMAVVVVATIAGTLLGPLGSSVADSTGQVDVQAENVTANNEFQELRGYDIASGSVTVTDSDGNAVDSSNFTVQNEGGAIRIDNSSSTVVSDGERVEVSYTYRATDGSTTTVAGLIPLMAALLILVTFAGRMTGMM
jgi:hypothetical protein